MTIIEGLASSEELRNVGTLLSSKGSPDKLLERSRSERLKVHTPFWNAHSKSFIWQTWKRVQWGQSSQPTEQVLRKFLSWTDKTKKSTTLSQKNKNHEKIANSDAQQQIDTQTLDTHHRWDPTSYPLPCINPVFSNLILARRISLSCENNNTDPISGAPPSDRKVHHVFGKPLSSCLHQFRLWNWKLLINLFLQLTECNLWLQNGHRLKETKNWNELVSNFKIWNLVLKQAGNQLPPTTCHPDCCHTADGRFRVESPYQEKKSKTTLDQ
jgi:hypothetical protein